ncbi:TRAP transporter small permease [Pseudooceanicola sp. CBS1P-1]|uniref:TRAP transporter small permease protein n=1 Tax=Pseudooceanicola albus TaxID=2692189 RepID=A0A6L7GAR0_9RHOB|nr:MULTISPECIES: TRAP transporter small permease [Pseudooceanicola]MBT9384409.1 TRAP transporter small permease [Pseudooceanicola endophyticus]MXN19853.1 TRAP transporter small permease subunit [Pseudooceanicola albus]
MLIFVERIAGLLGAVASVLARLCLIAIALVLFVQVVLRYGFSSTLPWPEEMSRYLMIWVVMLAGSLLVKDDQLVRVDFFDRFWPERLLLWRNILFRVLLAMLLGVMVWKGYENALFGARRQAVTLGISFYWIYLAVPVGAGLMMFHMLVAALQDILRGPRRADPSILNAEI